MPPQNYSRENNGIRLDLTGGINTMLPSDLMQQNYAYLQNVRRNLSGRAISRPALGGNILSSAFTNPPTSMIIMNDPYMIGPPPTFTVNTYVLVIGTGTNLYVASALLAPPVAIGSPIVQNLSGLPLSFVTFRPNTSPQPWCYVADPAMAVSLHQPVYPSTIYNNPICGMVKVRANNANVTPPTGILAYKTGIAEPQVPPFLTVTTGPPQPPPDTTGPYPSLSKSNNWVIYRYVYRSTVTGAQSNPSPECLAEIVPQAIAYGAQGAGSNPNVSYNNNQWQANPASGSGWQLRTSGSLAPGTLTSYIIATKFTLTTSPATSPPNTIPLDAQIQGVQVNVNLWAQSATGAGVIFNVALYYNENIIGTVKSPGIADTTTPTGYPFGSGDDNWGATLTPAIVQDPSFGFGVQILCQEDGGSDRSFVGGLSMIIYYTQENAGMTAIQSPDPQVDKLDYYRSDQGLDNFTYVGTIENSAAGTGYPNRGDTFSDTLSDLAVAANPILEFDNYEPFPSIDLPRQGMVNVIAASTNVINNFNLVVPADAGTGPITDPTKTNFYPTVIQWVSGDAFNPRWLPGNDILLIPPGSQQQTAWVTYNRPFPDPDNPGAWDILANAGVVDPNTGLSVFSWPQPGNLTYQIAAPTLAAQPSPVIWGPTPESAQSQASFYFGLDPNNPGDLLWSKGNNFDSAPDTNRVYVTSPSEGLMNGVVTSEINAVFSTERFWLIYPNFADALATVTGAAGAQWTLIQAKATRGLYCRYAIAALGSRIVYRAKDCIAVSEGGGPEESVTDAIYNLFPHGGSSPQPVTIAGNTIYPPNDKNPNAQTIVLTPSYIFYDYQDINGTQRTLIFDFNAKGWSVDAYSPLVSCHLHAFGTTALSSPLPASAAPAQLLAGCVDGTVRQFGGAGTPESGTAIIATRSENGGDARALKRLGDVFFKAEIQSGTPLNVGLWQTQFTVPVAGFSPTTLAATTPPNPYYIVDFTSGFGSDLDNIGVLLSWPLGSSNTIELWQPDWIPLPETVQDRPSDWDDGGNPQNKFVQGFLLECDTFGNSKTFQVESDDGVLHTPVEVPFTQSGQAVRSFTFSPPFTAHMMRIVSTDGVQWRFGPSGGWDMSWMTQPYPESSTVWTTESSSLGLYGWCFIYQINLAYVSSAPVTLTVKTDQGSFALTYPPSTGGVDTPAKVLLKCPRNKWKVVSFSATSTGAFSLWKDLTEVWVRSWGETSEFHKINPFGADTTAAAQI